MYWQAIILHSSLSSQKQQNHKNVQYRTKKKNDSLHVHNIKYLEQRFTSKTSLLKGHKEVSHLTKIEVKIMQQLKIRN